MSANPIALDQKLWNYCNILRDDGLCGACTTGGFFPAAHDYLAKHHALDWAQKKKLKTGTFFGIELKTSRGLVV